MYSLRELNRKRPATMALLALPLLPVFILWALIEGMGIFLSNVREENVTKPN
jgi:hypothetical protein